MFLMAFVMFGSSVEAANGPNEQDWSSAYIVIDDGSANPKQLYNANKSVTISTVKNISYDKKTCHHLFPSFHRCSSFIH